MSTTDVLFAEGTAPFFACVGAAVTSTTALLGLSPLVIAICTLTSLLWTALLWIVFASYPRDIWQLPQVLFNLIVALLRTTAAYVGRGCQPRFPEWTFKFELLRAGMRALRGGIFAKYVVRSQNSRYFSKQFELLGKRGGPRSCAAHGTTMEIVTLNGLEHVWIRDRDDTTAESKTTKKKERFVVIYYHGGGYVLFAPHYFVDLMNRVRSAMMDTIKKRYPQLEDVSIECLLANYRKSPDFKYPVPQQDALLMFEYVVNHEQMDASHIVIMGDSAGGGLCMSTLLRLKQKGAEMPAGAMLSCPFVDFEVGDDADDSNCMLALALGKEMVKAHHPTPQDKATWGDACALYCDLSGLPPALIQVGTLDTIYQSSIKLYEKAQADGLGKTWELDEFKNMPHAFTCLPESSLPDAKRGIQHIADFAVRQFARTRQ